MLDGLDHALDEAAGSRVTGRPVQQVNIQLRAGQSEGSGVIDLGVIDIDFSRRSLTSPRT